jgi:hypothetical protein
MYAQQKARPDTILLSSSLTIKIISVDYLRAIFMMYAAQKCHRQELEALKMAAASTCVSALSDDEVPPPQQASCNAADVPPKVAATPDVAVQLLTASFTIDDQSGTTAESVEQLQEAPRVMRSRRSSPLHQVKDWASFGDVAAFEIADAERRRLDDLMYPKQSPSPSRLAVFSTKACAATRRHPDDRLHRRTFLSTSHMPLNGMGTTPWAQLASSPPPLPAGLLLLLSP